MGALIDTLHEYTRADADVAFTPVDMRQVVENTLANLKHTIQERGVRITHGELPIIKGNATLLTQLLQNLIGNSIKYCEAVSPTVHVTATLEGDAWLFAVKDNGIGIPEEYYQRVFEPFKRLHGLGKYDGTGLGLATCKKIVERHRGLIWCESGEDQGTTFFFTLPRAEAAAAAPRRQPGPTSTRSATASARAVATHTP
jgi:light-regulated signal transduction histidine kinase (bacteriophytochrome)